MSTTKSEKTIILPSDVDQIVIREGEARPDLAPKAIVISGTLKAPRQFLDAKTELYEANQCHLRIYKDVGCLELHIQDTDPFTEHVIKGQLKGDTILAGFKINTDHRWTVQTFLKHIRMTAYYFEDRAQAAALILSLQKWSAKIETVIKEHQDKDGSSSMILEKKVNEVDLLRDFKLNIPVFQGYPKQKFTVSIGLDPASTKVDLYLISDELYELEPTLREKYIEAELQQFSNFACSQIEIS